VSAGLLAGLLGVLADQASQVVMIALSWYAIQHHMGSAGMVSDYQQVAQQLGHTPDFSAFFTRAYLEDGIGLPIVFSLIALTLEGLCATLGGWIGASLRRADAGHRQAAYMVVVTEAPVRLLLLAMGLDVLVWLATVEFNALGGAHRALGLSDLGTSLVTQGFGLWLLGFVVVLALAVVGGRFGDAAGEAGLSRS
jgi:hypothetical protein